MTSTTDETERQGVASAGGRRNGLWSRFSASRDGVAAMEFAILAIPFFLIVFATIETFVAFAGEQLLANATDDMARKIRTGQITAATGSATFRQEFCDEIAIMLTCGSGADPKLYLDVKSFPSFASMPVGIPRQGNQPYGDLDTTGFTFAPGAKGTPNMVRAYYRWRIMTDLVRPYITNVRPADGTMPTDYLMVATAAFQNEPFE